MNDYLGEHAPHVQDDDPPDPSGALAVDAVMLIGAAIVLLVAGWLLVSGALLLSGTP